MLYYGPISQDNIDYIEIMSRGDMKYASWLHLIDTH